MRFYARDQPRSAAAVGWLVSFGARWLALVCLLVVVPASSHALVAAATHLSAKVPPWALFVRLGWVVVFIAPARSLAKYERLLPIAPVTWKVVRHSVLAGVAPLAALLVCTESAWVLGVLLAPSHRWLVGMAAESVVYLVGITALGSLDRYKPASVDAQGVGGATAYEMQRFGLD